MSNRGGARPLSPVLTLRQQIEAAQATIVHLRRQNERIHTRASPGGDLTNTALAWYASWWEGELKRYQDTDLHRLWELVDALGQAERRGGVEEGEA